MMLPRRRRRLAYRTFALLAFAALWSGCSSPPTPPPAPTPTRDRVTPTATAAGEATLRLLPNGVIVTLLPYQGGAEAQLQVGLLAGSDFAAPGLAELAAEILVSGSNVTNERASLRQVVANLGGSIEVEVNPLTTWITCRVPGGKWHTLQDAIAAALATPTASRAQIERLREQFVVTRIQDVWREPTREVPRAFLLGNRGTSPYIASLLERDASEISLFMGRLYRPESTVLALSVPGREEATMARLTTGMATWPRPAAARQTVEVTERRLEPGLHWAAAGPADRCRAMLVLGLPDLGDLFAPEALVLHACLTLDGIGGRLEELQRKNGLGHVTWQSDFVDLANVPALVLSTEVTPAEAASLWTLVQSARESFTTVPPTPSELALGVRRARLTAQLLDGNSAARGRTAAMAATRRQPEGALASRLATLEQPGRFNAIAAARNYLRQPAAMIVLGAQPPEDLAESAFETFELLPPGALARLAGGNPKAQAAAASPWVDSAIEAAGGKERLAQLRGFESAVTLRSEGAPTVEESIRWDPRADTIERVRTLLGTTITATIDASQATETDGTEKKPMPPTEVQMLRRQLARHPTTLLAAAARGEIEFRPVAQRTVGDRDLILLEAVGPEFDRLRIHLDTVSHLIRVVEVWETASNGSLFHVRDAWSDYRNAAALRVPFRRLTEVDDGQTRVEAVVSRWQPVTERQ
ncbi:MAG: hypothetical protein NXI31_14360 [bacterium]|nr:hypothetical protein [bacterium]